MIIVRLIGGLGSQMSEYAYAKKLQSQGYNVKIDNTEYETYKTYNYELDKFQIDLETSTNEENNFFKNNFLFFKLLIFFLPKKILHKVLNKLGIKIYNDNVIYEKNFLFHRSLLNIPDNSYLIGDFKSEKYFKDIRPILLNQFTIKGNKSNYYKNVLSKIKSKKNTCFIHVRRGDFANNKKVRLVHGVCSQEYYLNAVKFIQSKIKEVHFFIFSNDISWCKENINLKKTTFVDNNNRHSPNEDIILMSMCDHSIIDHSAFCWWGAWLNKNPNAIVVSPKKWFSDNTLQLESKDIYCNGWIKM